MHARSLFAIALFLVACKSTKDAPKPTETAKPAEATKPTEPAKPAEAAKPVALTDAELTAGERAKMNRDMNDEIEKEKTVKEMTAEAKGPEIDVALAALQAIADGSFDGSTIDPTSVLVALDYTGAKPSERELCGTNAGLTKDITAAGPQLKKALERRMVHCRTAADKHVRCDVEPVDDGVTRTFVYEIVMDTDAQLRAYSKERSAANAGDLRDKALARKPTKRCADSHSH
jgi:hypothetical protein